MWKLGRKKSASETDERTFPAEKEFWLVRGAFREWQADRSGQGYYGLCDCWAEAVCPPGERSWQDRVYAQYSVLEHVAAEDATVSALKEKMRLDILMDDTHPVLLLQLGPVSSLAPVTAALASACGGEGWTLRVK